MVTELALLPISGGFVYKVLSKRCVAVHSPFLRGPRTSPSSTVIFHRLSSHFGLHRLPSHWWHVPFHLHGLEKACFRADRASVLDS